MMRDVHRSLITLFGCALLHASAVAQTAAEAESSLFTLDTAVARVDSDGDGIPDAWETARGLNPLVADANGNPDGDALTNLQEYNADSDPQVSESGTLAFAVSALFTLQTRTDAPDQDGDGLPDAWETANGLNSALSDASADPDGDGLTNLQEYNGGWHPLVAENAALSSSQSALFLTDTGAYPSGYTLDTDGDGMPDWWEVKYGLNRLVNDAASNPDGDDLSSVQEYLAGRNPAVDDLSGEVQQPSALFTLDTIGLAPDTDQDGMPDAWETARGLNPLVADANADPDGDGRTNIEEYNANTDPQVNDWLGPTSLASANFLLDTGAYPGGYSLDSDSDGMPDWWEARYGLNLLVIDATANPDTDDLTNLQEYKAGTNPIVFDFLEIIFAVGNVFPLNTGGAFTDTDGDGLPDWWERLYTGSSTTVLPGGDLDNDGLNNFLEFAFGTDPTLGTSGPTGLTMTGPFAAAVFGVNGQPITKVEPVANGVDFRLVFIRRADHVAAGLTYTPEFSGDHFTTLTPSAIIPTVLAARDGFELVSVPYPHFLPSGKKARFFRVSVTLTP
jgi:clumping factor A